MLPDETDHGYFPGDRKGPLLQRTLAKTRLKEFEEERFLGRDENAEGEQCTSVQAARDRPRLDHFSSGFEIQLAKNRRISANTSRKTQMSSEAFERHG